VSPDPGRGELRLSSTGASSYREFEATTRYLGGERRDMTVSRIGRGIADLNSYDQFFGNLRNPIVRANERNLIPTDAPPRIVRGTLGLPGSGTFTRASPIGIFGRSQRVSDFVGPRNRAGRLPRVQTLDFSLSRPWHVGKRRFRAGLKTYNVFGASAERDVQNNVTSPDYGTFYNPIERSIGFVFGSAR
jgi:hypothetical protein